MTIVLIYPERKKMLAVAFIDSHAGKKKIEMTAKSKSSAEKNTAKRKKSYTPVIIPAWCKSCGICSAFCPKKVIGCDDTGAPVIEKPDECIGCRFCELHCPDFAITVQERNRETQGNRS
ncbi:MAG: 4Fe-4S binding protein [Deltaproteobacteria bacterium]